MLQKRRPGGGTQLRPDGAAIDGHPLQQIRRGGGRHRQQPMGAPHLAAAHADRRGHDLARRQSVQQQAHRRHIRQSVHGAHLVEMDVLHRHTVDMALRLGDQPVHRQHVGLHPLRQAQMVTHHVLHPVQARVVMVPVIMVMVVMAVLMHGLGFLRAVYFHRHMGTLHAAARHRFAAVDHARHADGVQLRQGRFPVRHQLQQRRRQHIARRAHGAVQIQCFHGDPSDRDKCCSDYTRPCRNLQRQEAEKHLAVPRQLRSCLSADPCAQICALPHFLCTAPPCKAQKYCLLHSLRANRALA